jgi:hypothetical protein
MKNKKMNNRILGLIEDRLDLGYIRYGKTADELIDSGRDFEQEALEEILDGMVYTASRILELMDKRLISRYNKYNKKQRRANG